MAAKAYDIIVFGATGYTGKLVALYLARKYLSSLRICLSGRSQEKLAHLKLSLQQPEAAATRICAVIPCDLSDNARVREIVRQGRVVLSTAGPYISSHGENIIAACAEFGVDYVDVSGELTWNLRMINKYQELAKETGARLVQNAGLCSLPSDLGVFIAEEYLKNKHDDRLKSARAVWTTVEMAVSGGTFTSIIGEFAGGSDVLAALEDPYMLIPPKMRHICQPVPARLGLGRYDADERRYVAYFPACEMNARVVRRSLALVHEQGDIGQLPTYEESFGSGFDSSVIKGLLPSTLLSIALPTLLKAMKVGVVRSMLLLIGPKAGQGPRESDLKGRLEISVTARSEKSRRLIKVRISVPEEPAYKFTAVMASETAVALAVSGTEPPLRGKSGFLTPASCCGRVLVDRLKSENFSCDVIDDVLDTAGA